MGCSRCGHENPTGNFFCGNCGSPLLHKDAPSQHETDSSWSAKPAPARSQERPLSGPSFLGLSSEVEEDRPAVSLLYEEDGPPHHYGRLVLAVLVLAVFGSIIAYQWKKRPNWRAALRKPIASQTAYPAQTPAAESSPGVPIAQSRVPTESATPPEASLAPAPKAGNPSELLAANTPHNLPQADPDHSSRRYSAPAPRTSDELPAARTPSSQDGTDALLARGLAYLYGRGTPRSCSEALVFLNSAAAKGNARANSQLGGLYATGRCVPLDRAKAYRYFTQARDTGGGSVYLERTRQMLWTQMSDAERAQLRSIP